MKYTRALVGGCVVTLLSVELDPAIEPPQHVEIEHTTNTTTGLTTTVSLNSTTTTTSTMMPPDGYP
jgi:hypothetical protein